MKVTPERISAESDRATVNLRAALRAGNMDLAQTLASLKVGLRICAGEIPVKLKHVRL